MIRKIDGGVFVGEVVYKNVLTKEQEIAAAAIERYRKEKSKLLKADLIKIIEDIIPIFK